MKKHTPVHSSEGHNTDHGVFASGGAVRQGGQSRFFKNARDAFGKFLSTENRFTGRTSAAHPVQTDEIWEKSSGHSDGGHSKSQKPVLPRR